MDIILNGASGRMGINMINSAAKCDDINIIAKVDVHGDDCYKSLDEYQGPADCVVDFSHHTAVNAICAYCVKRNLPAVIATTGHTEEEKAVIKEAAKSIPVFYAANMSLGIAVTAALAKTAAAAFPNAEIEIIEAHHDQKLDVPSGTALILADSIKEVRPEAVYNIGRHENGKRTKEEIGIHSLRLGNEVGTHEVIITTGFETITLKHQAHDRALFADGAIAAVRVLKDKPAGLYDMKEIVK